jgi:hypothetical protein
LRENFLPPGCAGHSLTPKRKILTVGHQFRRLQLCHDVWRTLENRSSANASCKELRKSAVVLQRCRQVGLLGAQRLFVNSQRPLINGPGLRVLALVVIDQRQVVEALGYDRVLRPVAGVSTRGLDPDAKASPNVSTRYRTFCKARSL